MRELPHGADVCAQHVINQQPHVQDKDINVMNLSGRYDVAVTPTHGAANKWNQHDDHQQRRLSTIRLRKMRILNLPARSQAQLVRKSAEATIQSLKKQADECVTFGTRFLTKVGLLQPRGANMPPWPDGLEERSDLKSSGENAIARHRRILTAGQKYESGGFSSHMLFESYKSQKRSSRN